MCDRVMYDAGLPRTATVASIVHEGRWRWLVSNSTKLLILKEATATLHFLPSGNPDSIKWLLSASGSSLSDQPGIILEKLNLKSHGSTLFGFRETYPKPPSFSG